MFSYYGSKSRVAKLYPRPVYPHLVEAFAGSARYALLYPELDVLLNDSYQVIADIWDYLIHATYEQIEALPNLKRGDDLRQLDISKVERDLLGFMVNRGVPYPHHIYTTWAAEGNEIERTKRRIMGYLHSIRHWEVMSVDYMQLPNIEATWFVDPPYQHGGHRYIENNIDYTQLAEWCLTRRGQVIVCENEGADWLPFQSLASMHGQRHSSTEMIFTFGGQDG